MGAMGTREDILERATALFAQHGGHGATLGQIADTVGLRKPSVLHHFPSKEALYDAVIEHALAPFQEALPGLLRAAIGEDPVGALLHEAQRIFRAHPERARLLLRELLDNPQGMQHRLRTAVKPWWDVIDAAMRRGQSVGVVRQEANPAAYLVHVAALLVTLEALRPSLRTLVDEDRADDVLDAELERIARIALLTTPTPCSGGVR